MPPSEAKTVLVVGGTRGIGHALARVYSADGWEVLATFREPEGMRRIRALPGQVTAHHLDLSRDAETTRLAQALSQRRIDVLLLAAGVYVPGQDEAATLPAPLWEYSFRINTIGPVRLAAQLTPALRRSESPRIVALGSTLGSLALARSGGNYAYRSSKAALNAAMRSLAADLRKDGIIVATLDPGHVRTDMTGGAGERSPDQAAVAIHAAIEGLSLDESGGFFDCDGAPIPW